MELPEPNPSIELLAQAGFVTETWSASDASGMIDDGFVLIGISDSPRDDDRPFTYSLIWPGPLSQIPYMVKERWINS